MASWEPKYKQVMLPGVHNHTKEIWWIVYEEIWENVLKTVDETWAKIFAVVKWQLQEINWFISPETIWRIEIQNWMIKDIIRISVWEK